MTTKTSEQVDCPGLLQRAFSAGCTRLGVISLHAGAGARTVVESAVAELHGSGIPTGVTRAPRVALEAGSDRDQITRIQLPEGTWVATTERLADTENRLELVEPIGCTTALGDLNIYRVINAGEVSVYGPDDPGSMDAVFRRLEEQSGGLVIADGAWERRSFAAPDLTQALIVVVGSGYSGNPSRSAAAVAYLVETLTLQRCPETAMRAWRGIESGRAAVAIDTGGNWLETFPADTDPTETIERLGSRVDRIDLPDGLEDAFLAPLSRSAFRCTLVIYDSTRLLVAPLYLKAWLKKEGRIEVVEPINLLAVATNPTNRTGPDAGADEFHRLVTEALPEIPVHDVRLEAQRKERKPIWKIW